MTSDSPAPETRDAAISPSILCVDDEPNILSALRRLFRSQGYKVHTADSAQAGLTVLEEHRIDLVTVSYTHLTLPTRGLE